MEPLWLKIMFWHEMDDYFRLGWMFSKSHGGYHRAEYGWIIEHRCECRKYERPPTPVKP